MMKIAAIGLVTHGLSSLVANHPVIAQAPAPVSPRAASVASNTKVSVGGANRLGTTSGRLDLDTNSAAVAPHAVVRVEGTVATGIRVTLDGSASTGGRIWFRWLQTSGVRVQLKAFDQPVTSFVVPQEAKSLVFVLVVGNGVGVDAHSINVAAQDSEGERDDVLLHADAGGDLAGVVGRKVILDGSKSEPEGRLRFRWMQLDGPRANIQTTGSTCSFIPEAAGSYHFALLVVGSNDFVSEASIATIQVRSSVQVTEFGSADRSAMALDEFSRVAILSLHGGSTYAPEMARTLEGIADHIDSHRSFKAAATELTTRLDRVVPRTPRQRGEWVDGFFNPWMVQVIERMKAEGIDLTKIADQDRPLTKLQRVQLAVQFRLTATGLRSSILGR